MNRLAETYPEEVDIRWLNVESAVGDQAFRFYRLVGHPGFILLAPDGSQLWIAQGEQEFEILSQIITDNMDR